MKEKTNYEVQFFDCEENYKNMYKMLTGKINQCKKQEADLLHQFKETMLKYYVKKDNSTNTKSVKSENDIRDLEQKNMDLQERLNYTNTDYDNLKKSTDIKISELEDKLKNDELKYQTLENSNKVLQANYESLTNKIISKEKEVENLKKSSKNKETEYNESLTKCKEKTDKIYSENQIKEDKSNNKILEESKISEKLKKKLQSLEEKVDNNFADELVRGEKINTNLDLVLKKLTNINDKAIDLDENVEKEKNRLVPKFMQTDEFNTMLQRTKVDVSKKLDVILFEGINKARNVYKQINDFSDTFLNVLGNRKKCMENMEEVKNDNIKLKEVLAELEIKERLSKK